MGKLMMFIFVLVLMAAMISKGAEACGGVSDKCDDSDACCDGYLCSGNPDAVCIDPLSLFSG